MKVFFLWLAFAAVALAGTITIQLPGGGERVLTEAQFARYQAETNAEFRAVLMLGWQGEICRVHGHHGGSITSVDLLHRPNPNVVAWCRVCEMEYNYHQKDNP